MFETDLGAVFAGRHVSLLHPAVLTQPQLAAHSGRLPTDGNHRVDHLTGVSSAGLLIDQCLAALEVLFMVLKAWVRRLACRLLGDEDTLHLPVLTRGGGVLVHDHALVLKLLPELIVLIIAGAELVHLIAGENFCQTFNESPSRGSEVGYLAVTGVCEAGTLGTKTEDIEASGS